MFLTRTIYRGIIKSFQFVPLMLVVLAGSVAKGQNSREPHFVDHPINTRPVRFGWSAKSPVDREGIAFALRVGATGSILSGPLVIPGFGTSLGQQPGPAQASTWMPGYVLGIQTEIPFAERFYFAPEFNYFLNSTKITQGAMSSTVHMKGLELPVILKYKPFSGFNIFGGLGSDYLLAATETNSGPGTTPGASHAEKYGFKDFYFSWLAGIGYGFPSGLGLDLRYGKNLGTLSSQPSGKITSSFAQISLRYFFYEF